MGSLFKHLRDLTENKTPTLGPVPSSEGALFSDEGSCLERLKYHFCSLLNNTSSSAPPNDSPSRPCSQRPGTDAPPDEPFSPSEIGHTVKRLKNNKAAGICGLNSELLKYGGPAMLLFLYTLFSTIWQTEIIPAYCQSLANCFQWSCWSDVGASFEKSGDWSKLVLCRILQPSSRFSRFGKK